MRFLACLSLGFVLLGFVSCDSKKAETPVAEQLPKKPVAEVSGSLDFPEISVGESATKTLTIKNTGTATLVIEDTSYPEGMSSSGTDFRIEPGSELTVSVAFSPARPGAVNGVARLSSNAGKLEIPASGSGKELVGILDLPKELALDSVTVGEKATGSLLLRNTGNAPLNVTGITLPEGFHGEFSGSIEPGEERQVSVEFSPAEARTYAGQATVNLGAGRGTNSLEISGTGTPPPPAPPGMVTVSAGMLPSESPLAGEKVEAFHMATHETTWDEWMAVAEFAALNSYDLPKAPRGALPTHPVRNISWHEAVKWLNARSQMEGLRPVYSVNGEVYRRGIAEPVAEPTADGYRLPTEAEWEWAASGGTRSQGTRFSGGNDLNEVAWNWDNAIGTGEDLIDGRGPAEVGTKKPNELGLHDMSGNIAEWCWTPAQPGARRLRGGAWIGGEADCEISRQSFAGEGEKQNHVGFRQARNLVDPAHLAEQMMQSRRWNSSHPPPSQKPQRTPPTRRKSNCKAARRPML